MDVRKLGLSQTDLEALGYHVPKREQDDVVGGAPHLPTRRQSSGFGPWLWTLLTLGAVAWAAHPVQRMPDPVPANRPDTVFSSARAMSQLVDIARAPRPVGAPEHARVRAYLQDRLRGLGLDVDVQSTTRATRDSDTTAVVVRLHNVVARRPGTASTGTVVLTAHYDSAPLSMGAGDDGIGLAAVLETLRALTATAPLRNDVVVLMADAKELGSSGASAFLEQHPWAADTRAVIAIDARGVSGPMFLLGGSSVGAPLIPLAAEALVGPAAFSAFDALDPLAPGDTDLDPFARRGIAGLSLEARGGRAAHDGALDRPIRVSEATLQHAGAQLLALTRTLGSTELGSALPEPNTTSDDARASAFFSLPLLGLVDYPASWSLPATGVLVLAFVLLVTLIWRRRTGPIGLLAGVALGAVVAAAGAGLGLLLVEILSRMHPEMGHVEAALYRESPPMAALAALVVSFGTATYAAARQRYAQRDLLVGSLLIPAVAMGVLTLAAPHAAALLQLPFACGLAAALLLSLLHSRPRGRWTRIVALAAGSGVLVLAMPGIALLAASVTMLQAPWIGVAVALATLLLLPAVEALLHPKPWALPGAALLVALGALVLSSPRLVGEARHPLPTSLVLLVDDTLTVDGNGWTDGGPRADPAVSGPDSVPGTIAEASGADPRWMPSRWLTVPGVGEAWAMTWVVDPSGRGDHPGPLLLPSDAWSVAGVGPESLLGAPSVRADDEGPQKAAGPAGASRPVRVEIRPGLRADMVSLRVADGSGGVLDAAGGEGISSPTGRPGVRAVTFWGYPEDEPLTATFRAEEGSPLVFDVVEHHLRPAEVLGESFFQRADSVVADASTGSDRLVQRVRVRIPPS